MQTEKQETEVLKEVDRGKFFIFFVDDKEFRIEKESMLGGEIMDLASIPREVGLILIQEDGTQMQINADQIIHLKPGLRFKKAPHFRRG